MPLEFYTGGDMLPQGLGFFSSRDHGPVRPAQHDPGSRLAQNARPSADSSEEQAGEERDCTLPWASFFMGRLRLMKQFQVSHASSIGPSGHWARCTLQ